MTKSSAAMSATTILNHLADNLAEAYDRYDVGHIRACISDLYKQLPRKLALTYTFVASLPHGCTAVEAGHALAITPRAALIRLQKLERLGLLMQITIKPGQHNGARLRFAARSSVLGIRRHDDV